MSKFKNLLTFLILFIQISVSWSQIHRAVSPNEYHAKYTVNVTKPLLANVNQTVSPESLKDDRISQNNLIELSNSQTQFQVWIFSVLGALLVGLSGVVPVLIVPRLIYDHEKLIRSTLFKCMVAFAAGSLLGNVFLHLLPETFTFLVLGIIL